MKYLVFIGMIIFIIGTIIYIRGMLKNHVKPNGVSWFFWSLTPLIAGFAALSSGVTWASIPVFASALGSLTIFILSFIIKEAYWKLEKFDLFCGSFSFLALILWAITKNPIIAIIFSLISDFLAFIPTAVKSWKNPDTESAGYYMTSVISNLSAFFAIEEWNFASVAFPAYLAIGNIMIIIFIKYRGSVKKDNIK